MIKELNNLVVLPLSCSNFRSMKKIFALGLFICISTVLMAQGTTDCSFAQLYTLKTVMNKDAALQLLQRLDMQMLTDEKTGQSETIIYNPVNTSCFSGRNTKLQLEFVNNKLTQAFISTEYAKPDYDAMMKNFYVLRNAVKQQWSVEKEIDLPVENTYCKGFDYSNDAKNKSASQTISLQYFDATTDEQNAIYMLEIVFVNSAGKRLAGNIKY